MDDDEQQEGGPRPRVVDKRVSARTQPRRSEPATAPPAGTTQPEGAPPASPAAMPDAGAPPEGDALWTPEQEAEAQAFARQVLETPSRDWVLNTAVTLANVAAAKLDGGMAADAQVAIDALAGLVDAIGSRLGDAEAPVRQTLAQLQMAYAQAMPPPGP